ncbi:MAG: CD225/dispanin family protein [Acidobacteria bacterium]|nr:CD225/dispanin family protein [Acidobacteriota bacterium]
MIYCPQCGTPNADTASVCGNCQTALPQATPQSAPTPGAPPAAAAPRPPVQVNNYLIPAIVVTICCCLPGGIVAIVYAAQVNTKLQAGDIAGAQLASNNAKLWCIISAMVGLVGTIGYLALTFMGALSGF